MVSLSVVSVFFLSVLGYYFVGSLYSLRKNIQSAKKTGLPYVIVPLYAYNPIWLLTGRKLVKWYSRKYPTSWLTKNLFMFMHPDWTWLYRYEPFQKHGDVFITVSPASIQIWVADREVIAQITARRDDFPKPAYMYKTINTFGRNVVTTEGQEWRFHRKVTSPSFGEKNNSLVFEETKRQGIQMLRKWTGNDGKGHITVRDVLEDTMRLSLHVISGAGFGVALQWPGEGKDEEFGPISATSTHKHTLSFKDALANLLHNLLVVLVFPSWLLRNLPFKWAKKAAEAYVEYDAYMNELFNEKKQQALAGERTDGMDIMGALVKNSYSPEMRMANNNSKAKSEKGDVERQTLSDSEILGNAFVFLLAGHETSAGALHYGLIYLALHPDSQRHLQADIDKIFGDRPLEDWDYNKDITAMQNSMIAAVMHEELRVVPPVVNIPKQVVDHEDQVVIVKGKRTVWPKGAVVGLISIALHNNPKYWHSTGPSKVTDEDNDIGDFVPERWLAGASNGNDEKQAVLSKEGGGDVSDGKDSGPLFHPMKSTYIPFSDGPRSCLGKRFAQVEIMILLAMIFKRYSVELAVDDVASDEEVQKMNDEEKVQLYNKQRQAARETIMTASRVQITVQIRKADIPIRLVPRGEESFINLIAH